MIGNFWIESGDVDPRGTPVRRRPARRPNPHRNPPTGPGFFEIAGEVMEMDADELRELTEDVEPIRRNPRSSDLAPGSPGFGDHSAPTVEPARQTPHERRERDRRRKHAREILFGRSDAGTPGDVDQPDAEVGERLEESERVNLDAERRVRLASERMRNLSADDTTRLCEQQARAVAEGRLRRHWPREKEWDDLTAEQKLATGLLPDWDAPPPGALAEFLAESGDIDHDGRPVRQEAA